MGEPNFTQGLLDLPTGWWLAARVEFERRRTDQVAVDPTDGGAGSVSAAASPQGVDHRDAQTAGTQPGHGPPPSRHGQGPKPNADNEPTAVDPAVESCSTCEGTGLVDDPSACGDEDHCAPLVPCPNGCQEETDATG